MNALEYSFLFTPDLLETLMRTTRGSLKSKGRTFSSWHLCPTVLLDSIKNAGNPHAKWSNIPWSINPVDQGRVQNILEIHKQHVKCGQRGQLTKIETLRFRSWKHTACAAQAISTPQRLEIEGTISTTSQHWHQTMESSFAANSL